MAQLVGPDGKPVDSQGKQIVLPGLSISDPVMSLNLLGSVARSSYVMSAQYKSIRVAGPKGERNIKIQAQDIATLTGQSATVAEFASNVVAELAFTLAEAEARIAVLKGLLPEDKIAEGEKADMAVGTEWENRRSIFSNSVPLLIKANKPLGPALATAIAGEPPTQADFDNIKEASIKAGLIPDPANAPTEGAPAQTEQPAAETAVEPS
jgi:hypothetical protein